MAFHAFHTLSFPWPALGAGSECEVAEIPVFKEPPEQLLIGRVLREALIADRRGAEVV